MTVKKYYLILSIAAILLSSCEEDIIQTSCGGEKIEVISDQQVIFLDSVDGPVILSFDRGILYPCQESAVYSEFISQQADLAALFGKVLSYSAELEELKQAFRPEDLVQKCFASTLSISIKDSLMLPEWINYEIFEVNEEYGNGYGYFINYNGFKIKQDMIGGVPGIQPYKTRHDAFIACMLDLYKINVFDTFGSAERELDFFKIDY